MKFRLVLLILLSTIYLFIVFFSSVYIHELVHKFEYRNIPTENENICLSILMKCEGHFGMYSADYDPEFQEEVNNLKNKELYAGIITVIYYLVLLFLFAWFWEGK